MNYNDYLWLFTDCWLTAKRLPTNTAMEQLASELAQEYIDTEFADCSDWKEIYAELYKALCEQHIPVPSNRYFLAVPTPTLQLLPCIQIAEITPVKGDFTILDYVQQV